MNLSANNTSKPALAPYFAAAYGAAYGVASHDDAPQQDKHEDNIFTVIRTAHESMRGLMRHVLAAEDVETRQEFMAALQQAAILHMRVEEATLYNHLRTTPLWPLIMDSYTEYEQIENLFAEIARLTAARNSDEAAFFEKYSHLCAHMEQHMYDEEVNVLPQASCLLSEDEARLLGAEMRGLKGVYSESVLTARQLTNDAVRLKAYEVT